MVVALTLLVAWFATNVALLALAAVLDRRAGDDDAAGSASPGRGQVVRMPHLRRAG